MKESIRIEPSSVRVIDEVCRTSALSPTWKIKAPCVWPKRPPRPRLDSDTANLAPAPTTTSERKKRAAGACTAVA